MSPHGELPGRRGPAGSLDVAVIGSGVAGLGAAWLLSKRHRVTLYERESRLGGHTNTVNARVDGQVVPVDTGFIVYNESNYPNLTRLFATLGVATHESNMSFSVSLDGGALEYNGGSIGGLLVQPTNLLKPGYRRMIADCARFFREAAGLLRHPHTFGPTLGEWLDAENYSREFIDDHLLPMAAAIWSAPLRAMRDFPAHSFVQFFHNHGLLNFNGRPAWRTVTGGAIQYVRKLAGSVACRVGDGVAAVSPMRDAVIVHEQNGLARRFDRVVIATHADQALALLRAPTAQERRVLGAFAYQPNHAVLHRDPALMPQRRRAWASWNYLGARGDGDDDRSVSVTYWMNRLQGLTDAPPLFVSLNPLRPPRADLTLAAFDYNHPVFNTAALAAQAELPSIQGVRNMWFCGSWCGYGFHEDALASGLAAAEALGGVRRPWTVEPKTMAPPVPSRPTVGDEAAAEAGD